MKRVNISALRMMEVILLLSLASSNVVINVAYAETTRRDAGGDNAMRKAQYMLRQLSQEKSALQADKAKLDAKVESLSAKVGELEESVEKYKKKLGESNDNNSQLVDRVNRDHERMQALQEKIRETIGFLQASKEDNGHLINAVQERNQWIDTCRTRNSKMYHTNIELLGLYENKGVMKSLGQGEPVTQIGAVKVENEVQEYQFRLEDLRMNQFMSANDRDVVQR
jgi:chromosome segregation ATPase